MDDSTTPQQLTIGVTGINDLAKAALSCSNDQVAKWNGSVWACANDVGGGVGDGYIGVAGGHTAGGQLNMGTNSICFGADCKNAWPAGGGSGDIEGVTAGSGLTGGGTTGTVTLNVVAGSGLLTGSDVIGLNTGALFSGCGNATTGKVWWDGGNSRLACGTDANTDTNTQLSEATVEGYVTNGIGTIAMNNSTRLETDEVRARDSGGLYLRDDSGTAGIFVEDGGDVGIGKTPTYKLDVNGTSRFSSIGAGNGHPLAGYGIRAEGTTAAGVFTYSAAIKTTLANSSYAIDTIGDVKINGQMGVGNLAPDNAYGIKSQGSTAGGYFKDSGSDKEVYLGYGNYAIYSDLGNAYINGYVGIGNDSSPNSDLEVSNTGNPQIRITSTDNNTPSLIFDRVGGSDWQISDDRGRLEMRTSTDASSWGDPNMIMYNKRVGINLASGTDPSYTLHVKDTFIQNGNTRTIATFCTSDDTCFRVKSKNNHSTPNYYGQTKTGLCAGGVIARGWDTCNSMTTQYNCDGTKGFTEPCLDVWGGNPTSCGASVCTCDQSSSYRWVLCGLDGGPFSSDRPRVWLEPDIF